MAATPEVSVVIPTRNRRRQVLQTATAALGQRDVAVEVVVVDDASQDGTADALEALDDDRIRVVRCDVHAGQARARNAGVAQARAPWTALLDDDDRWAPAKLRDQLDAAATEDADFVYASALLVDAQGRVHEILQAPAPAELVRLVHRRNVVPAGASNVLARTELLRRLGPFDPELNHLTDWDLWIRLAAAGRPARCPEPLVAYVLHDDNHHVREAAAIAGEARLLERKHAAAGLPTRPDRAALDGWAGLAHARGGRHLAAAGLFLRAAVRGERRVHLAGAVSAVLQHLGVWRPRPPAELAAPEWLQPGR